MVAVGASYNSKRSFESFSFNAVDINPADPGFGLPRELGVKLELPAVLAGGVSATPLPDLLMAADVKYLFYENASGFAATSPIAQPAGSIGGLGWENRLVVAV